jgi:hypothetical protein
MRELLRAGNLPACVATAYLRPEICGADRPGLRSRSTPPPLSLQIATRLPPPGVNSETDSKPKAPEIATQPTARPEYRGSATELLEKTT